MRYPARRAKCLLQCRGRSLDRLLVELRVAVVPLQSLLVEKLLGGEVAGRGVVLVDGGQQDAAGRRFRGLGEHLPPTVVGVVVAPAPIQGDHHDRLPRPQQHKSLGKQRVDDLFGVGNPAAHASVTDGHGDVGLEGRRAETASIRPGQHVASKSRIKSPQQGCQSNKTTLAHVNSHDGRLPMQEINDSVIVRRTSFASTFSLILLPSRLCAFA